MADLDKMARELLARWHLDRGLGEKVAQDCRDGVVDIPKIYWELIRTALLTAPPGYVLVPMDIDPAAAMDVLAGDGLGRADEDADLHQVFGWLLLFWKEYKQKLAAAPEVK